MSAPIRDHGGVIDKYIGDGARKSFDIAEQHGHDATLPAAELAALLNAELRKQDARAVVSVEGVAPVAHEKVAYTWTATALRRSGGPVPGQCSRFFVAAVRLLQQQYDLAPEE